MLLFSVLNGRAGKARSTAMPSPFFTYTHIMCYIMFASELFMCETGYLWKYGLKITSKYLRKHFYTFIEQDEVFKL